MQTDYYELLGVSREADTDEIKRAYRTLARQYHPDINKDPEAEGRFKKIAEAYETLSDPEKKREYDYRGQGFSGFTPVEDLFSHFTQQHAPARPRRGADIQQIVDLTFEESVFGTTKAIRYLKQSACQSCKGTGSRDGQSKKCLRCQGHGRITVHRKLGPITVQENVMCPECSGQGVKIEQACTTCSGSGLTTQDSVINLTIPPGALTGTTLNAEGQGHCSARGIGPSGNLLVLINVKKHPNLEVEAGTLNLKYKLKLNVLHTLIGTSVKIKAPDYRLNTLTEITLTIPPGTGVAKKFRVAQKGLKHIQQPDYIGDLILDIDYTVPAISDPETVQKIQNLIAGSGL